LARFSRSWFDQFVVATRDELVGYLLRMLRSRDDAREVSQEAYLKLFVALRSYPERDHVPKALLYTTARNLAISRIRHQQIVDKSVVAVTVNEEMHADRQSPERHARNSEDLRSLLSIVNLLPPRCRKVLMLRLVEGLSQKEIAATLGIAVSTVEKHLAKALHNSSRAMREHKAAQAEVSVDVKRAALRGAAL
jgi:RNA polymerase sigma-70 factor (ECF subfamily)